MSTATVSPERLAPAHDAAEAPRVEIVVPVHNEQAALPDSIRRLHDHLSAELPYSWRIVIADNASTDGTPRLARALADDLPGVASLRLPAKGRGRALRAAWSRSDAEVLCYMDVDLSTDLRGLLPLLAPLLSGHSDVAIGTRLARGARVERSARRELISRGYNRLLRTVLRARFSDAQCGFKAIRADAARRLLPRVRDEGWFFDTELLVLAQRDGMRISEVPVDWVEDRDSRVALVSTAVDDLRGVARLLAGAPLARFLALGVASTVAYALLYVLLRDPVGAAGANALALALTGVANTQANRHLTFGVRGRRRLWQHHARGAIVFLAALAVTSGALTVMHAIDARPARAVEVGVMAVASAVTSVARFIALKAWVFADPRRYRVVRWAMARANVA
jgi:glycosyltransferase involved in cell wall biosynthesis